MKKKIYVTKLSYHNLRIHPFKILFMKIFIAFFIGSICISVCFGQKNGSIIKRANVEYPEYDKIGWH